MKIKTKVRYIFYHFLVIIAVIYISFFNYTNTFTTALDTIAFRAGTMKCKLAFLSTLYILTLAFYYCIDNFRSDTNNLLNREED